MRINTLRGMLTWFYMLEMNQVTLYKAQAFLAEHDLDRRMFTKAAEIEAGHVDNIAAALRRRGWEVSGITRVAALTGLCGGTLTGLSLHVALRANIALENKAMADYKWLIERCDDPELCETLWSNCLDESLHTEWFKARLQRDIDQLPLL
ncbi:MAG TPA: ferritin-like domain-containing protein [Firmicutes bacterium]|nr:ferritin-like domain-containing protein [Bacillota bacterium]